MSVLDVTSNTYYASFSAAIAGSQANDVIQLSAGSYVEDFPDITHSLTIQSVGGLASLTTLSAQPVNGRAILNVPGDGNVSLTVSGLALSGAVDANNNGAGILFESGNGALTVLNSHIFGNQDGILTGGADAASTAGMSVTVKNSEIDHNGVAPSNPRYGFDHNIYAGALTQLTVQDSYIHDALGGHEIKTRALSSTITGNRIQDGATADSSYSIDLSDGGAAVVSGNVIEKGMASPNRYIVDYGAEGTYSGTGLTLDDNTIINDRSGGATVLYNRTQGSGGASIPTTISDNIIYGTGPGTLYQDEFGPPYDVASGNSYPSTAPPPLDTSSPFAVAEPAGVWVVPLVLLAAARLRRWRAGWERMVS